MHVPIGHDTEDRPAHVHLAPGTVILLIGDPRTGRTTLARHLARCWLADLPRHLRLDADRPHEYADLTRRAAPRTVVDPERELTLRDRRWPTRSMALENIVLAGPAILIAEPALALPLTESLDMRSTCVIAIQPPGRRRNRTLRAAGEQGAPRLDLPADARMIRIAAFGVVDQPPHRWHMATTGS